MDLSEGKCKRKLKFMSYQEKLNAIDLIGKGKSQRKIAKELGIGRTTLYNAIKNREKIIEASKKFPEGTNRRRISSTKHPEIEKTVIAYISEARENGEKLTGSAIQSIALEAASKLHIQDFSGSNGWLFSFLRRNNICLKNLNESADVQKKLEITGIDNFEENCDKEIDMFNENSDGALEKFDYSQTIENQEYVTSTINWRDWCRLCGNMETLAEIEHSILEIVIKILNISSEEYTRICINCYGSLATISEMIIKSKFVENMFIELEECEKANDNFITQDNVLRIRDRYDMKDDLFVKDQPSEAVETMMNTKLEQHRYVPEHFDENEESIFEHNSREKVQKATEWNVHNQCNNYNNDVENDDAEMMEIENSNNDLMNKEISDLEVNISKSSNSTKQKENTTNRLSEEDMFKYICHICDETFTRMCFLTNHTRNFHGTLPQVSCTCGRILATWESLMNHKRKHSTEPRDWICDLCNASFITKNGLTIHIKFKHQTQQQQLHLCTICGKEFKDTYTLKSHERTHLPVEERYIYECNICTKKFTQRGSLKIHISSVHNGQKSIMCHLCSKSFSSNHYLKIHILTHSIENVRCDICDSVFKNRVSLQNHKKKIHKPRENLNFSCPECDKKFHNRNHLERHMPAHTGERNFKCNYENCNNAFKWEKDLRNHMARHYGERRHKCLWCDRMFVDSGNMRKHKIRYHAEQLAEFELKYGKRRRLKDLLVDSHETH